MKYIIIAIALIGFIAFNAAAQDLNFNEEIRKRIESNNQNSKDSTFRQAQRPGKEEGTQRPGKEEGRRAQRPNGKKTVTADDIPWNVIEENTPTSNTPAGKQRETGKRLPLDPDEIPRDKYGEPVVEYDETDTITNPAYLDRSELIVDEDSFLYRKTDTVIKPLEMAPEALYWSRVSGINIRKRVPAHFTFKDTVFVNPLFMPLLLKEKDVYPLDPIQLYIPVDLVGDNLNQPLYTTKPLFQQELLRFHVREMAYRYVQYCCPSSFKLIETHLPTETTHFIRKSDIETIPVEKVEVDPADLHPPVKFLPDRRYWTSAFESALKFSQNYISPNWYKGGTGNLNVFTKNQLQYNYEKGRVRFKNLLELNASVYNAPQDSMRAYKMGDDLLRLYGNLGYQAFSKWYYTLGAEFKTQMFANFQENTDVRQAALLSPYIVNLELGMKYDFSKQFKRKDRSLAFTLNMAPISYIYMYSIDEGIDLGRHGFHKKTGTEELDNELSQLGSTVRLDLTLKPNRNVTWKSRIYYFTSYDHVVTEVENSLDLAISRFFSTLIYLHFRYDDGVVKTENFNTYMQLNEILSFGFGYKW
jgi:hypothetical protein